MAESEATMSLGEELYRRIMDGDLEAPDIFSRSQADESLNEMPSDPNMPKPKRTPVFQLARERRQQQMNAPAQSNAPLQVKKMPANFGRMTKSVLANRPQMPQPQMPQLQMRQAQVPQFYNPLGGGQFQQRQQTPLMAINPNAMFMR